MNDSTSLPIKFPREVYDRMVDLRRDLHRHPELSNREQDTAQRLIARLQQLGIPFQANFGGTGIVADIPGAQAGPRVALRADTDALPIHEETGLTFSSVHDGVMHACGHDGHSSMLMGAAELLVKGPPPPLPVRLIWQPAEEVGTGAQAMIEAGVLENVGLIFGGHLDRRYPAGFLIVTEGPVNASTDTFDVHIQGQQGHGARPHEAVDTVVVGSLFVTSLQTIVSREVDPAHPSVVSVGSFQAGTAPNVIAGQAHLRGTIRAQDPEVRAHLQRSIGRIAKAIGELHDAEIEVTLHSGSPSVINAPAMVSLAKEAAVHIVGADRVRPLHTSNMGGEDFAYYLDHVPGCYIRFGGQIEGLEGFPTHSSRFDFDERALAAGSAWFVEIARRAGQHLLEGK
ncbi:MAG: amidohydrolase [Nitrospinaceae bacterium]|nr:amidohydrolase [Nitrospinaceae bacterium]NIR53993.1 amidohydrolase [Nitrospinaceae bacterium]NIS84412.1 amidohydrolase [Nitrospinaceae bacterium]NIT81203.1 amidohydrolase [Nitrospinaceae bacterium]NIU43492.1 amidohydrolase [Nitrospinaceae bacterium]